MRCPSFYLQCLQPSAPQASSEIINGSTVSEHPEDHFLTAVASYARSAGEGIYQADNDGTSYYVSLNQVPGTGWMLISSVSKGDVLGEMNAFLVAVIIAAILIIILIAVILYLMTKKIVTDPIKRLTDNIEHIAAGDFTIEIDGSGGDEIGRVQDALKEIPSIPCTACRYCVDGCPKQIAIPDIFEALNTHLVWHDDTLAAELYKEATEDGGKASDCIKCRRCERACPQQIKITRHLEEAVCIFQ